MRTKMNINNWLCKHFDEDKKGYVTLSNIIFYPIEHILTWIFDHIFELLWLSIIIFFVGGISALIQGFITESYPNTFKDMVIVILRGWVAPGIIIILSIIYYKPLKYVFSLKVAKCPLKEKEQKEAE